MTRDHEAGGDHEAEGPSDLAPWEWRRPWTMKLDWDHGGCTRRPKNSIFILYMGLVGTIRLEKTMADGLASK